MTLRRKKFEPEKLSVHSKISYLLLVVAMIVQFYIGIPHLTDTDPAGLFFGTFAVLEGVFALISLISIDIIRGLGVRIYPKQETFRTIGTTTMMVFIVSLTLNMMIQFISAVPLTIKDIEMALAIVFAAPCEEYFFRGVLMEIFFKTSEYEKKKYKVGNTFITAGIFLGLFFSSAMFAVLHVNYYDDIRLMLIVFLGGLVYAVAYYYSKDITGVILAHFVLNVIAVGQMFFLFNL